MGIRLPEIERNEEEADAYRHGYEEARDLLKSDPHIGYSEAQRLAYITGYRRGMLDKVNEGAITVNKARELMGYHPFEEPPTMEIFLSEKFEPPILFPVEPETIQIKLDPEKSNGYTHIDGRIPAGHSEAWGKGFIQGLSNLPLPDVAFGSPWEASDYVKGHDEAVRGLLKAKVISYERAGELIDIDDPPAFPESPVEPVFDPVKIPGHYNSGTIEVANFIADQGLDYVSGNVIKYVARAGKKDPAKEIEDLEKAAAYLQMRHNLANGLPAVVRDPETKEVVWSLFRN